MKFGFEQRWRSSVKKVLDLYVDEDFWSSVPPLGKLGKPEVLEVSRDGDSAVTRLRYKLSVDLPKQASHFVDPDNASWVQVTKWDMGDATAEMDFLPDEGAALLKAGASVEVVKDGREVVRTIKGEVRFRVPIVGHRVEGIVVDGIGDYLDDEAEAVADVLES